MRILLFDIDGTLLLTDGGGKFALQAAIEEEFAVSSPCTDISFSGRTDRALLAELLRLNDLPDDEDHQNRLGARYVSILPSVLAQRGGRVLPGVAELLSRLTRCDDVGCYVMTGNLHRSATHKLAHFDLLCCVRGIFGGDRDLHREDLARRSAAVLQQRYGGQAIEETIVIGDTPADVRCGHAIGARVVAVCTGFFDRQELEAESPMCVEDDLSDVDRLLKLLVGGQ